jgi:enoyl-CoA hydratase
VAAVRTLSEPDAPLLVQADGPVRIVTLDQPDTRNAFRPPLRQAVHRIWRELGDDTAVRAVVLTGAGSAFSAGGDIENFARNIADPEVRRRSIRQAAQLTEDLLAFPFPVVAAVNGPAVGLGCSLAVMCDIVLMGESAYFADTHVSVGLVAGDGGTVVWPLLMSLLTAKQHLMLGTPIDAREAYRIGLANQVVPDEELMSTALELAHRLAQQPPQAVQDTKRALNLHLQQAARTVLPFALAAESESFGTEAVRATVEKFSRRRKPRPPDGQGPQAS